MLLVAPDAPHGARLPSVPGRAWWPGSRVSVTAFCAWRVTPTLTWSASVSNVWELDAVRDGQAVPGSGTRRLTVATGLSFRSGAHTTWSASLMADPWLEGLGVNAAATVRATLGVTWAL